MNKHTIGMLAGVLVLFLLSCILFEGRLAPAMWQLTSLFWIVFWTYRCDKEKNG